MNFIRLERTYVLNDAPLMINSLMDCVIVRLSQLLVPYKIIADSRHLNRRRAMRLDMKTLTEWSEAWWDKLGPIYQEAFTHGAKPERVLRSMLERGIACLHAGMVGDEAMAMAVTGFRGKESDRRLILDYIAVRDTCASSFERPNLTNPCSVSSTRHGIPEARICSAALRHPFQISA